MTVSPDSLLPDVINIAKKAGKAILDVYAEDDFDIKLKEGDSPLTRADIDSNRIIQNELRTLDPSLPLISEESEAVLYEERKSWHYYWLVDPLDGTKEFIKRNDEFTVNIALIKKDTPILGVVYAPALGVMYSAAENAGSFRQKKNEEPYKIGVSGYDSGKLKIVASRSHAKEELEQFLKRIDEHEKIEVGSSLKLCMVAEGSAHLYPRFGPTMEWDTAAAQCVVTEAGGSVTDFHGNHLRYNKPDLHNPSFIVNGSSDYIWKRYYG